MISGFKKVESVNAALVVAEKNNVILAIRSVDGEYDYVTWLKDVKGGVAHGNYFGGNFIGAVKDFILRSEKALN